MSDEIQPNPAPDAPEPTSPPADDAVTSDPAEMNRAIAADADQNGPDAEIVECPTCHNPRRKFLIVNGQCDSCRTQNQPAAIVPTLGWPEVRARRDRVLGSTDWSQLADINPDVQTSYADVRRRLRDVTKEAEPFGAWYALDTIEADIAKL
jgi:hypothetical protein